MKLREWVLYCIGLGVLFGGVVVVLVIRTHMPTDFSQDYAAALNSSHTAHPPFATLVALPFALTPWPVAKWLLFLVSFGAVITSWVLLELSSGTVLLFIPLWIYAFIAGTLEPLLLVLLAGAVRWQDRPWAGALLGAAISLKVYPVVLVLGLVVARRYRAALWTVATVAILSGVAELVVGGTWRWVQFVPVNVQQWIGFAGNMSVVHLMREVFPHASPFYLSATLLGCLTIPLLARLRTDPLRPLVAVMLLTGPLLWPQYMTLLVLVPLGRVVRVCLAVAGPLALLVLLALLALLAYEPMASVWRVMPLLSACSLGALGLVWVSSVCPRLSLYGRPQTATK